MSEYDYVWQINRFSLMTSLLNVLNEKGFDSSSYVLAQYFLQNFDKLEYLNIYDVSEECFVSRSGVQRFCKSIGFETFSTFKSAAAVEREVHKTTFIAYANRPDFQDYTRQAMSEMLLEIGSLTAQQDLSGFARKIHDSKNVVLLTAEVSSMTPRDLQQALLVAGKLVHLVTDSHPDLGLLESLDENDLLIVCSSTGNYAYAVNDVLLNITRPYKSLITLNRDQLFTQNYQKIFYLSEQASDHQRSIYTKYGLGYFLDLLYSTYLEQYYSKDRH